MYASLGGALAASGILLTVIAALIFRHPKAPEWTQGGLVVELVAVVLAAIVGLGLGYLAVAALSFESAAVRWVDLAGLGTCLAVLIIGWWLIDPRRRLQRYGSAAARARPRPTWSISIRRRRRRARAPSPAKPHSSERQRASSFRRCRRSSEQGPAPRTRAPRAPCHESE